MTPNTTQAAAPSADETALELSPRSVRALRTARTTALAGLLAAAVISALLGHRADEGPGPVSSDTSTTAERAVAARKNLRTAQMLASAYTAERTAAGAQWTKKTQAAFVADHQLPGTQLDVSDATIVLRADQQPRCVTTFPTGFSEPGPSGRSTKSPAPRSVCGPATFGPDVLDTRTKAQRRDALITQTANLARSVRALGDGTTTDVRHLSPENIAKTYGPVMDPGATLELRNPGSPTPTLVITQDGCSVEATLAAGTVTTSVLACD